MEKSHASNMKLFTYPPEIEVFTNSSKVTFLRNMQRKII